MKKRTSILIAAICLLIHDPAGYRLARGTASHYHGVTDAVGSPTLSHVDLPSVNTTV